MEKQIKIPRLVIAGIHSGVGKTTIVTGLLAALRQKGIQVQSYKVGPDYIDPGYHRLASGRPSYNLDTWLMPAAEIPASFARTAKGADLAIVEGVMGLYDGGRAGVSSTAAIAKLLSAPVLLVIDAKAMGESVAAMALGYKLYDPKVQFAGVIVNRLGSATHQAIAVAALTKAGIPVFGCLLRNEKLVMPERHLGLTPVSEHEAQANVEAMGEQVSKQLEIEQLLSLARAATPLTVAENTRQQVPAAVRIGVAEDEVFTFYYKESLAALAEAGAELVPFSPLHDKVLPAVDGLVLGGGFPEMFASELAANTAMLQAVRNACQAGMPVYAECGGFMYLARQIVDFSGQAYNMAAVVPAVCKMQAKLETVGYVEAKARTDNVLTPADGILRGHEFHFSRMLPDAGEEDFPWAFEFKKMRTGAQHLGGFAAQRIVASYLHMHFAGNKPAAERFVAQCTAFRREQEKR